MPSEPTVLADRYQLLRSLGAGPVGEVWEGRDLVLGRPVAVKLVHDRLAADAFRARLRSLARDAAKVQHPNVAAVLDVDADGRFVVTELVEGPSARRLLAEGRTLPPEATMRLVAGACSALSAAHAVGVLHRGLKPENLLIAPDGGVKVTDFALAKAGPDPGLAAVRYLAPEELATGQVDDRSDLYALGCCLYELVCGRPPFDGPTPFAVASAHVNERPHRPGSIRPDISQDLEQVVARALAKHPNNRFQTPAELRQALQRVAAAPHPSPAPPAAAPQPTAPQPAAAPPAAAPPAAASPGTPEPAPPDSGAPAREGSPAGNGTAPVVHTPTPVVHTPAPFPTPAPAHTPAPAGAGTPPERRRLVATLVAVGLLAGTGAVLTATRPSSVTSASTAAATSATAARRPASAVSPATRSTELVPVVAGATQAEATERLRQAGLPLGTVRRIRGGGIPGGHAIGTTPMAGETLRPGERVTLVLSTGASPTSVDDLIALIDANPRAAGTRAPSFRKRLARLDALHGRRRQAELADLLRIARAGAANGDFSFGFSAAAVRVLDRLV